MTWLQRLHGGFNVLPAWAVDSALAAVVAVVELSLLSLDPAQFDQAAIGYEGPTAAAVVLLLAASSPRHCPWPCAAPTRARALAIIAVALGFAGYLGIPTSGFGVVV